ncbi:SAGA-associated factor 29 [[Candida] railenensis]|uniref:SAGA-associated factor 29 n=1 Tax=[Candida] railenensis TaxID=45579 RepID=A0A9P0QK83_9ASCO|nr:SAGA-associated factor 29 [[Candida] railenensis]
MPAETEGYWDIIVTSLQDICNANEATSFDNKFKPYLSRSLDNENLEELKSEVFEHKSNVSTSKRLVNTSQQNLGILIEKLKAEAETSATTVASGGSGKSAASGKSNASKANGSSPMIAKRGSGKSSSGSKGGSGKSFSKDNKKITKKAGRSYYTSMYNPSEPIYVGSEVVYKLKNRHAEEWIQCEVMRVIGDGIKFEIRDPEPDENNNINPTFKANYKEILLIPPLNEVPDLVNYTYGCKVLARYPETTTFYTAVVVGNKKDGKVRLKFDGEDEINKETEVERRLVLPFPEK